MTSSISRRVAQLFGKGTNSRLRGASPKGARLVEYRCAAICHPKVLPGSAGVRCQGTRAQMPGLCRPRCGRRRRACPGRGSRAFDRSSAATSWRCAGRTCPRRAAAASPARSRSAARPGPAARPQPPPWSPDVCLAAGAQQRGQVAEAEVASRVLLARPDSRPAAVPAARLSARPRRRRPGHSRAGGQAAGCTRRLLVASDSDLSLAARQPRPSCGAGPAVACAARSRRAGRARHPRRPRAPAASALRRGRRPAPGTPGTKPWPSPRHPATRRRTAPGHLCRAGQDRGSRLAATL